MVYFYVQRIPLPTSFIFQKRVQQTGVNENSLLYSDRKLQKNLINSLKHRFCFNLSFDFSQFDFCGNNQSK
jgi:hypothetical protein